jgi:broad specificity phosphatase PhoE
MVTRHASRDDAPAYLLRYEARRKRAAADAADGDSSDDFVARARHRATERALEQLTRDDVPPDRTVAFALETTSPRELQLPQEFRSRTAGATDVRLIRHGQVQGYVTDGGLTPTGRWQAHRKGQDLAKGLTEGQTVRLLYGRTARARETAFGVREGLLQAMGRYGIGEVIVEEPRPGPAFDNFQAWFDGKEMDITAAFQEYARIHDVYQRTGSGDRPGWMIEFERFWRIQFAGGDPITHWLAMPLQYVEPPALVVRRWWKGIIEAVKEGPDDLRLFVCAHSGPIRAVATHAVGHDPGEPNNIEDVRIRLFADLEHAVLTYRGRGVEIEVPTTVTPSWFA